MMAALAGWWRRWSAEDDPDLMLADKADMIAFALRRRRRPGWSIGIIADSDEDYVCIMLSKPCGCTFEFAVKPPASTTDFAELLATTEMTLGATKCPVKAESPWELDDDGKHECKPIGGKIVAVEF